MNTAQLLGTGIIGISCLALIGYTSYDVIYWIYQWFKTKLSCWNYQQQGLDFWPSQSSYHSHQTPLYITSPFGQLASILNHCGSINNKTLIDCGCGKGNILIEANQFPFKALAGIDIDPDLIKICHQNINHCDMTSKTTLYTGSLQEHESIIASYDIIYCYGVYQKTALRSLCTYLATQKTAKQVIYRNLTDPTPFYETGFQLQYHHHNCNLADYEIWVFAINT